MSAILESAAQCLPRADADRARIRYACARVDAISRDAWTTLSDDEQARAARYHFAADRIRFCATRALLRRALGIYLGCDPQRIAFAYGDHGKPRLADDRFGRLHFNVSHSGAYALLAFSAEAEVGVDVEQVRSGLDVDALAQRAFHEDDAAALCGLCGLPKIMRFYELWTANEARLKAHGAGLALDDSADPRDADGALQNISAPAGYFAAIATTARALTLRRWAELETPDDCVRVAP